MVTVAELGLEDPAIREMSAQLCRVIGGAVPDPASVASLRWGLAQALLDHCRRRDRADSDRALALRDVAADAAAQRRREEHAVLCSAFARYIADWSIRRVATEWQRFGEETEALIAPAPEPVAEASDFPIVRRAA